MAAIFQRRKATTGRRRNGHREAHRYLNRELSWLDFNERVLAFAEDPRQPLLERAKFLAICAANLDEFFQIRVAGLKRQEAAGQLTLSTDGMTAGEQLTEIGTRVRDQADRHAGIFADVVRPGLAAAGVPVVRWKELAEAAHNPRNHRYSASKGIPNLRLACATLYRRRFGVELDPETQVLNTIGAKEGLSHLMWVLLEPGDSALVPSPSYPIHIHGPILAGASKPLSVASMRTIEG